MATIIGFTGTRNGVTKPQYATLRKQLLRNVGGFEFHHGDCFGADEDAHNLCVLLRRSQGLNLHIHSHPPENVVLRAFCLADVMSPPKPYLERNHDIVDACSMLIACPATRWETVRSGTWATVRYARDAGKPVAIIFPGGEIERNGSWS